MSDLRDIKNGFTIVELLIVVIVISILATITIVSYTGIQKRSADKAIESDLRSFAASAENYKLTNGRYPAMTSTELDTLSFKASKASYGDAGNGQGAGNGSTGGYNLGYCVNDSTSTYVIYAVSPSGKAFRYTSGGLKEMTPVVNGWPVCSIVSVSSTNPSWGRNASANTWLNWVE